ncbi:MAG: flavodoxin domain-containing protein, partial [Parvularculaceae bacterium]|nr:flavodoxin domain-containing protein [Parvularculaceae bacterium]
AAASYNGAAPDNAAKFVAGLGAAAEGAARGVSFAVFGCGNRDWASTFQAVPRAIDEKLEALGATRLVERGEADARDDLDGQFHAWFDSLFPRLGAALGIALEPLAAADAEPLYQVDLVESVSNNPVANQTGARPMRVVENRELQDVVRSGRSTRHLEIEMPEGVSYRPGDHLCVVPPNRAEVIDRAMARFGFRDEDHVRITATGGRRSPFPRDSALSVRRIAEVYGELQTTASRKDVATLARHTRCPATRARLEALSAPAENGRDLYRAEVFLKHRSILDLMEENPAAELPFPVFLEMIPWMAPRYYSISSSPRSTPGRCSITVGVVEAPARSGRGVYKGVCSSHLSAARPGDFVQAVVRETKSAFRLPEDPSRPIIMIG